MCPWEISITLPNREGDRCGQWKNNTNKFEYTYFIENSRNFERKPKRHLIL
jgi:hypothetical protein